QELLYYIKWMLVNNTVPGLEKVPVYIDSPLGIKATRVYAACGAECYDDETKILARSGDLFEFDTLKVAETADESKLINEAKGCNIIISASGMCDAGRIRHHLKNNLFKATTTVVFAGYQAVGTIGRMLTDGAKKIKILGVPVMVNADIQRIQGFSGHADQRELLNWVDEIDQKPAKIFLVHGEDSAIDALRDKLEERGYDVAVPGIFEEFDLESGEVYATETKLVKPAQGKASKPSKASNIKAELKRLMVALIDAVQDSARVQDLADNVSELADQLEQRLK
ncbi:MAG: MBL fold metallo-hydrolase, partial [Clostridia bacterium]|nr:MBL fold metallo-hydrolase [Clostridia bacterium]